MEQNKTEGNKTEKIERKDIELNKTEDNERNGTVDQKSMKTPSPSIILETYLLFDCPCNRR